MNYTSARYDGPFNGRNVSGNAPGLVAGRARPTHSASSSISSNDGKAGNYDVASSHEANGSNGSSHTSSQHHYDSSGEFNDRFGNGLAGPSSRTGGMGQSGRSVGMQNISQGLREKASANYHHQQQHRRAQNSQDYDNSAQYAPYGNYTRDNSQSALTPATARLDRDTEGDSSFDYLLSPALAPVGPISLSNSIPPSGALMAPPPSHVPPSLQMSSAPGSNGPSVRPMMNRSQTAMPAASSSGRVYQAPAYQQQPQQPSYERDNTRAGSSHVPASSGQGSNPQRDYTPPPAISASALIDMVLKMRIGPSQPTSQNMAAASNSMSRSQSANAGGRVPTGQSVGISSAHNRNISSGSNRSDDDPTVGNGYAGGLQPPQHPGLARTTSSKNVIETNATPAVSGLETVVLSHQRVAEVPDEVIDVLAGTVNRLALSYNYIVTLPPSFARLGGTLRYLNIRLNMFTTFPPVLCEMPSLEILDISRNKIKRLPAQCGTLKNLRVFSISKNRVKRLPTYFADMKILKVLKIDHNPLEWPPREIVTQPTIGTSVDMTASKREGEAMAKLDEAQALQRWLGGLQDWIREHAHEAQAQTALPASISEESLPRDRSGSDLRNNELQQRQPPSVPLPILATSQQTQALPLPKSVVSPILRAKPSQEDLPSPEMDAARMSQHGRNASHSLATAAAQNKRGLRAKKSLPDLRQNHSQILDERFNDNDTAREDEPMPLSASQLGGRPRPTFKHSKTSSSSSGSPVTARPSAGIPTPPRSASSDKKQQLSLPTSSGSEDTLKDSLPPMRAAQNQFPRSRKNWIAPANNASQVPTERGSSGAYFRRLSMLPAFTISKAVPPSLLQFIDAIRGILFCLSQVHASIKQCVVFPAPDRLPANLSKLMASGEDAMGFLVDSLDRFDSNTRRGSPEVAVVKDVLETCRENVATFGKLVQALAEQIKTLFGPATDVRYTRTLIVSIYGAMGEIATSWAALTPLREEITIWMKGDGEGSPTALQLQPPSPLPRDDAQPFSHIASEAVNRPLPSPALAPTGTPINMQRQAALANARRHAGSFTNYNR